MTSSREAKPLSTQPWKICPAQVRSFECRRRGKEYRPLLVEPAGSGAPVEWMRLAERVLEQTLRQLLGPRVALEGLLASALLEAARAWPPALPREPLSMGLQRIAVAAALQHLRATRDSSAGGGEERPGGMRHLLGGVYAALGKLPPEDRVAFALLELGGHSAAEAAVVIGVPLHVVEQRARRARCRLLFAARRDALVLGYLRFAARWQTLSRRTDRRALGSLYSLAQ